MQTQDANIWQTQKRLPLVDLVNYRSPSTAYASEKLAQALLSCLHLNSHTLSIMVMALLDRNGYSIIEGHLMYSEMVYLFLFHGHRAITTMEMMRLLHLCLQLMFKSMPTRIKLKGIRWTEAAGSNMRRLQHCDRGHDGKCAGQLLQHSARQW